MFAGIRDAWGGSGPVAFAVYAGATLAAGAALYLAVERPFLRMREDVMRARPQPGSARTGALPPMAR